MSTRRPPPSSIPPNAQARDVGERLRRKIGESRSNAYDTAAPVPLTPGMRISDRYEVVRHLGRGAFCDVFEARDLTHNGAACAVKVPRAEGRRCAQLDARFRVEARAASMLESPHTAPALDFGVLADGRPFYAMEFLKGLSLSGLLARDRLVHPAHVAMIGIDILHALHEAHERTIIHRDIKPSNALLVHHPHAPRPYVRLIDFGIAKVMDGADWDRSSLDLTGSGRSPCTPLYAAPEQLRGFVAPRSDLYSLAVLLATLLDGQPPYHALSGAHLVSAQMGEEPVPWGPRTRQSALFDVIALAGNKDPSQRFDSAMAMRRALRIVRETIAQGAAVPPLLLAEQDLDFEGAETTEVGDISWL